MRLGNIYTATNCNMHCEHRGVEAQMEKLRMRSRRLHWSRRHEAWCATEKTHTATHAKKRRREHAEQTPRRLSTNGKGANAAIRFSTSRHLPPPSLTSLMATDIISPIWQRHKKKSIHLQSTVGSWLFSCRWPLSTKASLACLRSWVDLLPRCLVLLEQYTRECCSCGAGFSLQCIFFAAPFLLFAVLCWLKKRYCAVPGCSIRCANIKCARMRKGSLLPL